MRPIRLEIEGLQSFQEKQVIDFKALTSKGLFGIFGNTGSGKSTIIDAMTFALYGEVVRIKGGNGSNKDIINTTTKKTNISFTFEIGSDLYIAERETKLTKGGELGKASCRLEKNGLVIADRQSEFKKKIIDIIGIEMADFTRSVVLPQGKFGEFLKLKGIDRNKMLERIFNLQKYGGEIANKIKDKRNELTKEVRSIDDQVKGKGEDLTTENLNKLKEEVEENKKRKEEEEKKIQDLEKKVEEQKNLAQSYKEKEIEEGKKEELDLKKIIIEEKKDRIEEGKKANYIHKDLIEYKKRKEELEEDLKNRKNLEEERKSFEIKKGEKKEEKKRIELSLEEINEKLKKNELSREEIERVEKLKGIKEQYNINIEELDSLINRKEGEEKKLLEKKREREELKEKIEEIEETLSKLVPVDEVELIKIEQEIKGLNLEDVKKIEKELEKEKNKLSENRKVYKKIVDEIKNLEESYNEKRRMERENIAIFLGKDLEEGAPCPVCGSKTHPLIKEGVAEELTHLEKEIGGIEEKLKKKRMERDKLPLEEGERNIERLVKGLDKRDSKKLEEKYLELKNSYNKKEKELEKYRLEKERKEKEEKKEKELLVEKDKEIIVIQGKLEGIENHIEALEIKIKKIIEDTGSIDKDYLDEKEEKLNKKNIGSEIERIGEKEANYKLLKKEWENLKEASEKIREVLEKLEGKKVELENKLAALQGQIIAREKEVKERKKLLDSIIKESSFKGIEEVESKIIDEKELELEEREVLSYNEEVKEVKVKLGEILKKIDNRIFDVENYEANLEELTKLREDLKKNIGEIGSLEARIKKMEEELENVRILIEAREKFQEKLDRYNDLASLFKGNKFVEFLALGKLSGISKIASIRLGKITNGRYSLMIGKDGNFRIRDNFNNGETRNVATLSGGESFLVSLSLALALSLQIQLKGKIQLEFFFLDEGFGTLDTNTLDKVIHNLQELRFNEELKVGIITHVERLKERIPKKLVLTEPENGEHGTLISVV